jgi:formate hydrogenlyase subunit 3/multisubunit Na+/H+ antiporter MnhD subunit
VSALLVAAVCAPFVAALVAPWSARAGAWGAVLAPLPALVVAVGGAGAVFDAPWFLLGSRLEVDPLGRPLLGAFALLWLLAGVFAAGTVKKERGAFWTWWHLASAGTLGVAVAADVPSFYLAFGLLTFASYGLVVHEGGARARRAGRIYVIFAVVGEAALLAGFVLAADLAGSLLLADVPEGLAGGARSGLAVGLLVVGFGVKAGLLGLHPWLPLAHPVAPTAASAVLSGAMVKAGLLGLVRFLPLGEASLSGAGWALVALGLAGALGAVVAGLAQRELKTVLAYSTVSQMGLMLAVVGVALAAPRSAPVAVAAVLAYAVHHGLAKGALFLGAGVAGRGGATARRIGVGGMALGALAVAGAPLTGGAVAKESAKEALAAGPEAWYGPLEALLQVSALATAALVGHAVLLARAQRSDAPFAAVVWVPWTVLLAALAAVPWALEPLLGVAPPAGPALDPAALWDGLWPLAAGLIVLALVRRRADVLRLPIPPGDVVVPLEAAGARAVAGLVRAADRLGALEEAAGGRLSAAGRAVHAVAALDARLTRWSTATALLVGISVAIAVVLA